MHACMHTYIQTYMLTLAPVDDAEVVVQPNELLCTFLSQPVCVNKIYMHAYVHAYAHAYAHEYVHACMHAHTCFSSDHE